MGAISLELVVPAAICLLLLLTASLLQTLIKAEAHPWHTWLRAVRIAKYVLSWYIISISFTLCNKWVLRYWHGDGFPFPVFVTAVHMSTKFAVTRVINRCFTKPEKRIRSLACREMLRGPIPIGCCTAVDVAFSNLSFLFISVTFYTILKSGAILWILVWAVLMRLEPLTWEIVAICGLVSTGVSLASYGEASFSWMGFLLVTGACASSGLRWALTQIMLEGKEGAPSVHRPALVNNRNMSEDESNAGNGSYRRRRSSGTDSSINGGMNGGGGGGGARVLELQEPVLDHSTTSTVHSSSSSASQLHLHHHFRPLEVLYHVSPASALSCIPVFLLVELQSCLASPVFRDPALLFQLCMILLVGGMISFLLVLAEVKLVKISSSLTMSMFGAVKEIITVAISMIVFNDSVTVLNVSGLLLAILGAVWYRQYKQKPSSSLAGSGGSVGGGAGRGRAPSQYLPGESGLFTLEDEGSSTEDDEEGNAQREAEGREGEGQEEEEEEEVVEFEMFPGIRNPNTAQLA